MRMELIEEIVDGILHRDEDQQLDTVIEVGEELADDLELLYSYQTTLQQYGTNEQFVAMAKLALPQDAELDTTTALESIGSKIGEYIHAFWQWLVGLVKKLKAFVFGEERKAAQEEKRSETLDKKVNIYTSELAKSEDKVLSHIGKQLEAVDLDGALDSIIEMTKRHDKELSEAFKPKEKEHVSTLRETFETLKKEHATVYPFSEVEKAHREFILARKTVEVSEHLINQYFQTKDLNKLDEAWHHQVVPNLKALDLPYMITIDSGHRSAASKGADLAYRDASKVSVFERSGWDRSKFVASRRIEREMRQALKQMGPTQLKTVEICEKHTEQLQHAADNLTSDQKYAMIKHMSALVRIENALFKRMRLLLSMTTNTNNTVASKAFQVARLAQKEAPHWRHKNTRS